MRFLFLLCFIMLFGCAEDPDPHPVEIVDRSIETHGGWQAYEDLDRVEVHKTIKLFDEDGKLESQDKQYQTFSFAPNYKTRIQGIWDGEPHEFYYDGKELRTLVKDSVVDTRWHNEKAIRTIQAAEFVFFQPFKLKDTLTIMEYTGKKVLYDSLEVSEVMVKYPNSRDTWWFYFDDEYHCVANRVLHNGRYSLIENLQFQNYKGLMLHKHRKSYFVDSLLNKKYLRAEYFYDIVE